MTSTEGDLFSGIVPGSAPKGFKRAMALGSRRHHPGGRPNSILIPGGIISFALIGQGPGQSFGRQPVLRGLDLDIATGEIMVVIGRSGSGSRCCLLPIGAPADAPVAQRLDHPLRAATSTGRAALGVVSRRPSSLHVGGMASRPGEAAGLPISRSEKPPAGWKGMGGKNPAEIRGMRKCVAIAGPVTEPEIVF
jgi:hypothetical protein